MELNTFNFQDTLDSNENVIVDFWAPWCGPCKRYKPTFEEFATSSNSKCFTVNIEAESSLAEDYGIMSIPCTIVFENGIEKTRKLGILSSNDLKSLDS
jgi:thioredoxin